MSDHIETPDWSRIPAPADDGATWRLKKGMRVPSVQLVATNWSIVDLSRRSGLMVLYVYPRISVPGVPNPEGWDQIPGARGCTAQACAFRDHHDELYDLGVDHLFGLSTQGPREQREAVVRLDLSFPLLSDSGLIFAKALGLPMLDVPGQVLLRRLTLVIRNGEVRHVFYPIFPPDGHAEEVMAWLRANPRL